MTPLFETIVSKVSHPDADPESDLQMQVSQLDYSSYLGVIGIGRVTRGSVKVNQQVTIVGADGKERNGKLVKSLATWVLTALKRTKLQQATSAPLPVWAS